MNATDFTDDDEDLDDFSDLVLTREQRAEMAKKVLAMMSAAAGGARLPERWQPIFEAWIEGEIDYVEFNRRISAPYLH